MDTQTYYQTILATYYDRSKKQKQLLRDELLAYLYSLFENEVPQEDFSKATVLLQEYKNTVTFEHFENQGKSQSPSAYATSLKIKKRSSSKDKAQRKSSSSRQENSDINIDYFDAHE